VRRAIGQGHGQLHFPGRPAASLVRMREYKRNPGDRRTGQTAFENRRREDQRKLERQRREIVPATRDSPQMREPELLSAATSPATTAPSLFAVTPADVHPNLPVVVVPSSDDSVVDSEDEQTTESSKSHEAEVSCEAPVIASESHAPTQVSTAAGIPHFHPQPIGVALGPAQWAVGEYGRESYPCLVPVRSPHLFLMNETVLTKTAGLSGVQKAGWSDLQRPRASLFGCECRPHAHPRPL
jgi:hypothetical protein